MQKEVKKITTKVLQEMKIRGEKISALTAYDYTMAKILDEVGIEIILVGDSASNVICGYETTIPMTLEAMIYHGKAVVRAVKRALVVIDMPFGTYQGDSLEALKSAIKIMKKTGASAVKLEGGEEVKDSIKRIISAGIPVMGHLGLTPQSIHKFGSYAVRATNQNEAEKLINDAKLLEKLGCFAIVLEKIPAKLGEQISRILSIPTIGIGAGSKVDGQILVLHDMLGLTTDFSPRFLRRYLNLYDLIKIAIKNYINDVKNLNFPSEKEEY